ncbi:MAG: helix-turn-helix transcriptional regulator [Blautia sp.]|nr:helix-turn-helix transcriptional regulator [Blautia sp.]
MLDEKNMSMYRLAKLSGVSKTTVIDICSGKR